MNNNHKIWLILMMMCFLTANTVFASDINDTMILNEDLSQ